jgi:hypothetical protein
MYDIHDLYEKKQHKWGMIFKLLFIYLLSHILLNFLIRKRKNQWNSLIFYRKLLTNHSLSKLCVENK